MNKIPFELQVLQSWDGWDEQDTGILMFTGAELGIDLAPFKVGDVVDYATFDLTNSVLVLGFQEEYGPVTEYKYEIKLTVTPVDEE